MKQLKALIIEDEDDSLITLEAVIADSLSEIIYVHTIARTYEDAVFILNEKKETYQLSIVDLQLGDKDGEKLFNEIDVSQLGIVVFGTIREEIKLKFEVIAELGETYPFLKPYSSKAARILKLQLLSDKRVISKNGFITSLHIRDGGNHILLPCDQIWFIENRKNYCLIFTKDEKGKQKPPYLIRSTLDSLEEKLDYSIFQRCHDSYIVNTTCIKRFIFNRDGGYLYFYREENKTGFIDSDGNDIEIKFSARFRKWIDKYYPLIKNVT